MRRLILTLVSLFPFAAAADSRYPMLSPCAKYEGALCGTITVPENRAAKNGRTLAIDVMVVPAKAAKPLADPMVPITGGGPGIASIPDAEDWVESFPEIHETRDMIFWDQRGTGEGDALDCPTGGGAATIRALLGGEMDVAMVARCRDELAQRADLRQYTTADAADDLEAVRKWLKAGKINLYGSSYTSRLVLVYTQRYPKNVRTVTVKAVTPVAAKNPLYVARDAQASLDRLFADCGSDAACREKYPTLRADFDAVMTSLAANPPKIGDLTLTSDIFAGIVRRMLYGADSQAALPLVIASVKRGEYAPLRPILGAGDRIDQLLNLGLFFSVTCAEDVAHFTEADIERTSRGTFSGNALSSALKGACNVWPAAKLRHDYEKKVKGVPALIISGVLDPDTPPVWGREMSRLLGGSVHLEVEGQAHTGMSPCVRQIVTRFVETGKNGALPTECLRELKRPAFR